MIDINNIRSVVEQIIVIDVKNSKFDKIKKFKKNSKRRIGEFRKWTEFTKCPYTEMSVYFSCSPYNAKRDTTTIRRVVFDTYAAVVITVTADAVKRS